MTASPAREDSARRRADLLALLAPLIAPAELDEQTSLLRSGLLDSLALFNLILWIEQQLNRPIDPAAVDFLAELDTVAGILRFIARNRPTDGE